MKLFLLIYLCIFNIYSQSLENKKQGMIWGSIYGDAFGGPYEFKNNPSHNVILKNKLLTVKNLKALAQSVRLTNYKRPRSIYGPWIDDAPAGTITDDSRHKIIFYQAIKNSKITRESLAESYISFYKSSNAYKDWLSEYVKSAYFIKDPDHLLASPLERLWGGMETQAGQMIFPWMALLFPNDPVKSYTETYNINFFDNGAAKDITSSLVAALSYALSEKSSWNGFIKTFKTTDPYRYSRVPFVQRKTLKLLEQANLIIKNSRNSPRKLFKLIRNSLNSKTWWEADIAFIIPIIFIEICQKEPLAAFALAREFGEDVDSYAQTIGAILGALYGIELFAQNEIDMLKSHLKDHYQLSNFKF